MYNTANMGPKKERWKEPITVKHTKKVYYNAYAGGYGAHGKDKKAIHKADRKKWKKECKNLIKEKEETKMRLRISEIIKVLSRYQKILNFFNENGHDERIKEIEVGEHLLITVEGHCGEVYKQEVWIDENNKLQVMNPETGISLFDVIEELMKKKLMKEGEMRNIF